EMALKQQMAPAQIAELYSRARLGDIQAREILTKLQPQEWFNRQAPWGQGANAFNSNVGTSESGGSYSLMGGAGNNYAGKYQFGAPRLTDLGVYTQGADENWSGPRANPANPWTGTFNIPGFPDVHTVQNFLKSPGAQEAVQQKSVQN